MPHEELLSCYCQLIALKRYSPATLKSYRGTFQLFLAHHSPRLPLQLTKHDVLDYLAGRVAAGISEAYQNTLINAIKFYCEQVGGAAPVVLRGAPPQTPADEPQGTGQGRSARPAPGHRQPGAPRHADAGLRARA